MTYAFRSPAWFTLCFGALLVSACGDDTVGRTEDSKDPVSAEDAGLDGAVEEDGAVQVPPAEDSDDASVPPQPGSGGGSAGTNLSLPNDGQYLSICYGDADCKDDRLDCFGAFRHTAGYCAPKCQTDADCPPMGDLRASCAIGGQCRVNCSGADDKGDGACPANMACRDFFDLSVVVGGEPSEPGLIKMWRCGYPVDAGSNHVARFQRCNLDHGHGDCQGDLLCHAPRSTLGSATNPGYCTDRCQAATECVVPAGTSAVPVCASGACELDCAGAGTTCPAGMNCRTVGLSSSQVQRCRFIEE